MLFENVCLHVMMRSSSSEDLIWMPLAVFMSEECHTIAS